MFALFVDADVCSDNDEFAVDTEQGPRARHLYALTCRFMYVCHQCLSVGGIRWLH